MKYATWLDRANVERWGAVIGDEVVAAEDCLATSNLDVPSSLGEFVRASDPAYWSEAAEAFTRGKSSGSANDVRFTAPYRDPATIFAAGANYAEHAEEARRAGALDGPPERPLIFSKAVSSICGPRDVIEWRQDLTAALDYEVELGVVLGIGGRDISRADALSHVFGYTVMNDVSARDVQLGRPGGQWFLGKSMDTYCPVGPYIVTADEFALSEPLQLTLRVNGSLRQSSDTSLLLFPVDELIEEISRYVTLSAGDWLATGTPSGVGASFAPPQYLDDGDIVEASISGIGALLNRIVRRDRS